MSRNTLKGHNYNFRPLSGGPKVEYDKFVQFVLKYNLTRQKGFSPDK